MIANSLGARERQFLGEPIRMASQIYISLARRMNMVPFEPGAPSLYDIAVALAFGFALAADLKVPPPPPRSLSMFAVLPRTSTVIPKRREKHVMEREPFFPLVVSLWAGRRHRLFHGVAH